MKRGFILFFVYNEQMLGRAQRGSLFFFLIFQDWDSQSMLKELLGNLLNYIIPGPNANVPMCLFVLLDELRPSKIWDELI